jgi:hypothetical protein
MPNAANDFEMDWTNVPMDADPVPLPPDHSEIEFCEEDVDTTQTGLPVFSDGDLITALAEVADEGASNANVGTIGSLAGGELRAVGFATAAGYIDAMRRGVPAATYRSYEATLRTQYGHTSAMIAALDLPGPMAPTTLPVGPGIVHTPTGPSVFDRPRAERAFLVGPKVDAPQRERVEFRAGDMIAGASMGGQHVLLNWSGTSGVTRGALCLALDAINRGEWVPEAPNARAQAGAAIETLARKGMDVKKAPHTEAGVHQWTVGEVNHTGTVGEKYGKVVLTITLVGSLMTYDAAGNPENTALGAAVVACYNARIAGETYKSTHLSAWLQETLRVRLGAVELGALGWVVPSRHARAAQELCKAVQSAGFGKRWQLPALPIATCDELRDGIVRGLTEEVTELLGKLATERGVAADAKLANPGRSGDLGEKRIGTYLTELRVIGARAIAYGQILGEHRVLEVREEVRKAIAELEGIRGDDYSGIEARFALIWEDIREEQLRKGIL